MKAFGFNPTKAFDKKNDYYLIRRQQDRREVIRFQPLLKYKDIKYVYKIECCTYFDEVDALTVHANEKYQRLANQEARGVTTGFELPYLHIPVVCFGLDYVYDTYREQPLDTKLRISDPASLDWFIQLSEYDLSTLFEEYNSLTKAAQSLQHPKSFYQKAYPHWYGCILDLYFAAKDSKASFLKQLDINELIYEQASDGFRLNLPKSMYNHYVEKLKEAFGWEIK